MRTLSIGIGSYPARQLWSSLSRTRKVSVVFGEIEIVEMWKRLNVLTFACSDCSTNRNLASAICEQCDNQKESDRKKLNNIIRLDRNFWWRTPPLLEIKSFPRKMVQFHSMRNGIDLRIPELLPAMTRKSNRQVVACKYPLQIQTIDIYAAAQLKPMNSAELKIEFCARSNYRNTHSFAAKIIPRLFWWKVLHMCIFTRTHTSTLMNRTGARNQITRVQRTVNTEHAPIHTHTKLMNNQNSWFHVRMRLLCIMCRVRLY